MNKANARAIVLNTPEDVDKYIVAKAVCGDLWYWGSWNNPEDAHHVARQFDNGCVVEMCDVQSENEN